MKGLSLAVVMYNVGGLPSFKRSPAILEQRASRGEGSNKDYKAGHKRNMDLLSVYENIVSVQEAKKKRRLMTNIVHGLDVVGSMSCSELWFKEAMRVVKTHVSPFVVELIAKQMAHSANYRVLEVELPGVLPYTTDIDNAAITLTQGDNVVQVPEELFDLKVFCNSLDKSLDLDECDPFQRANLSEFFTQHDVGGDYKVLTIKHWKYEVVHYIVLYGKLVDSDACAAELYPHF
jgi:hypothetical protein